jgi:peptidoglycan/LPS O-acetylase OafA/YrhL
MTSFGKKLTDNWQDTASLILGVWMILSPWILQFTGTPAAMWNAIVFGVLIAVMALMALVDFHEWEEWADMAIGAWLIVSAWVLGFAMTEAAAGAQGGAYAATWNFVVVGILTLGMAAWSLFDHRHRVHA